MRQKFINEVYMREVIDKEWYLEKDEQLNGYIALKYIKEISEPVTSFCNGQKKTRLDKGYSVLEYVPLDRKYNCRVFFDTLNRPLFFYFDVNNGSGVEKNMPWYDDLFLDVILECPALTDAGPYIHLVDEIEFKAAKNEGQIDEDTFNAGYTVAIELMHELRNQNNDIVNRCQFDLFRIKSLLGL